MTKEVISWFSQSIAMEREIFLVLTGTLQSLQMCMLRGVFGEVYMT